MNPIYNVEYGLIQTSLSLRKQCQLFNHLFCFTDAVATEVTEIELPFRLINPDDVLVARGQSATLTCKVETESTINLEYKWLFNGNEILQNDTRRQLLENGSLYIPKIASSWHSLEGEYKCFVKIKDTHEGLLSNAAKLKIASE